MQSKGRVSLNFIILKLLSSSRISLSGIELWKAAKAQGLKLNAAVYVWAAQLEEDGLVSYESETPGKLQEKSSKLQKLPTRTLLSLTSKGRRQTQRLLNAERELQRVFLELFQIPFSVDEFGF